MLRSVSKQSTVNPWSQSWRRKGRLRWEGFAEKEGFKFVVEEWVGDGVLAGGAGRREYRPIIHSTNELHLVLDKNWTNDLCNKIIGTDVLWLWVRYGVVVEEVVSDGDNGSLNRSYVTESIINSLNMEYLITETINIWSFEKTIKDLCFTCEFFMTALNAVATFFP